MIDVSSSSLLFKSSVVKLAFEGKILPCCFMFLQWDLCIWS
jgi:hypothetical protein